MKSTNLCSNLIGGDDVYSWYAVSTRISHMWGQSFIKCLLWKSEPIFLRTFSLKKKFFSRSFFLGLQWKQHFYPFHENIKLIHPWFVLIQVIVPMKLEMICYLGYPKIFMKIQRSLQFNDQQEKKTQVFFKFSLLCYSDWIRSVEFVPFLSHPIQNIFFWEKKTRFLVFVLIIFFLLLWDVRSFFFYFKLIMCVHFFFFFLIRYFTSKTTTKKMCIFLKHIWQKKTKQSSIFMFQLVLLISLSIYLVRLFLLLYYL